MAGLSQSQTLSQQQVLAPQLQQSLQILQAPMLELRNLIQQELCTNPTLEEDISEPTIEDKKREHEEFQEEFDRLAALVHGESAAVDLEQAQRAFDKAQARMAEFE